MRTNLQVRNRGLSILAAVAMLATALVTGATNAQAAERGSCRIVPEANNSDRFTLQVIDLATSTNHIALRNSGRFEQMLDTNRTEFRVLGDGDRAIRVYPSDGSSRYELPCPVVPDDNVNRTFCSSTPAEANAATVELYFAGLDARQVFVRRNDQWQATLDSNAKSWTDSNPAVGASYFIRVRQNKGPRIDIPCVSTEEGLRESTPEGYRWPASTDATDFTTTSYTGIGPLDDGRYRTAMSGDGSTTLLQDQDENSAVYRSTLYRLVFDTWEVQRINGGVMLSDISDDGSVVAYTRRGKLRIWNLDATRPDGFRDRSVLVDPSISQVIVAGDGEHVFYFSPDNNQAYRYSIATGEQIPVPGRMGRGTISDDGSRFLNQDTGEVVNLDTGERFPVFYSHADITSTMSGDGQTVATTEQLFPAPPAVALIDVATGASRGFEIVGRAYQVLALNDDATRVLLMNDDADRLWVHDFTDNTVSWVSSLILFYNGPTFDDDFTRRINNTSFADARGD